MTLPDSVEPLEMRVALWGTNSAHTRKRAAQRNENSASETFNINLLWCEFTWVRGKVRVWAVGRLTTASHGCVKGMWAVGLDQQSAPLARTIAVFCSSWAFLHPEAQPCTLALAPEGKNFPSRGLCDRVVSAVNLRFRGSTVAWVCGGWREPNSDAVWCLLALAA